MGETLFVDDGAMCHICLGVGTPFVSTHVLPVTLAAVLLNAYYRRICTIGEYLEAHVVCDG
jgi:hypothetical protein